MERDDAPIRAFKDDVLAHLGGQLVDVRSPGEYTGELLHMPDYPQEGAMRGGHIPGAKSVPWARAANDDGTFKSRADLEAIYQQEQGLSPDAATVAYCRIGERSSHTWFVLTHLLGFDERPQLRRLVDRVGQRRAGAGGAVSDAVAPPLVAAGDRRRLRRAARAAAARAAAGVQRGSARAAREVCRLAGLHGAGARVPVAAVPRGRGGRRGDDGRRGGPSRPVHLFFSAPPEAPTTRGFAGILHEGLDGLTVREVLAVPDDAPYRFALGEAVSPLRLRGMVGMLSRIKRQTALKARV